MNFHGRQVNKKVCAINSHYCIHQIALGVLSFRFFLTIQLGIDYHVESIEKVIAAMDPIGKMHQGLRADALVIGNAISSKLLYPNDDNEHKEKYSVVIKKLTMLETYPYFKDIARSCGIKIDSLRVVELSLCDALQSQIIKEQQESSKLSSEYLEKTNRRKIREIEMQDRQK